MTGFRWVDFAARAQPDFRNHVVTVDEVPALVARFGAEECYASIFRFSADVLRYLAEQRVGGRPSIAGYHGRLCQGRNGRLGAIYGVVRDTNRRREASFRPDRQADEKRHARGRAA
jgi:hypothetical protein